MPLRVPDWPSSDKRWEKWARELHQLMERLGPCPATAVHKLAHKQLNWSSSLTVNVMAWMSINKWATCEPDTSLWVTHKTTRIEYKEPQIKQAEPPKPKERAKRKRRCGICKATDHDRRKCPERYDSIRTARVASSSIDPDKRATG